MSEAAGLAAVPRIWSTGPGGGMMALMTGQTADSEYVPLPGGGAAVYQSTTLAYYRHVDWQGSARLATTPSRTLYSATQYAAFGQPFDSTVGADVSFTGQPQLYGTNTYNFPMRNLSPIQGRWWTPDPAGLAAVDASNPQTWNAYAYVNGDPLEEADPLGLCTPSWSFANGAYQVGGCTQDIPLEDALAEQDLLDLILATNQGRWVMFGHPPILVGVTRPGRQLEPSTAAPNTGGPSAGHCRGAALAENAAALGLDVAGDALAFFPGGGLALAGAQAGVALASTINSSVHQDVTGAVVGIAGFQIAPVGLAAAESAESSWARAVPFFGAVLTVAATLNDARATLRAYEVCKAGHP